MSYSPNFRGESDTIAAGSVAASYFNDSGDSMIKGTPGKINAAGDLGPIDVSSEADVFGIVGVVSEDIADQESGGVASSGRIKNIATTADFGSTVFIDKNGDLTDEKPNLGGNGFQSLDFVVSVGVIVRNEENPVLKDLIVNIAIRGQL